MTNMIILGLIVAFFASFAIGLFSATVYVRLGERADKNAKAAPAPRPANDDRLAA